MVRRIIKSKSGSYMVTLPREWIESLRLRYGVIPVEVDIQVIGDEVKIQPIIRLDKEIIVGTVSYPRLKA